MDLTHYGSHNASMTWRSRQLHRVTSHAARVKRALGIRAGFGVLHKLTRLNRKPATREPLPQKLREEIAAYFSDDVNLLGQLIGRDLSSWTLTNAG